MLEGGDDDVLDVQKRLQLFLGAYLSFFTSFKVASMEKGNPGWLLEGLKITESKFGKSFIATTRSARLLHVCVVRV